MLLNEYQRRATSTAVYPGQGEFLGTMYCALKLNGEAGEVAEKIGKVLRDDSSQISEEKRQALALELGDVLWYVASLAKELGYSLDRIADLNVKKLALRHRKGTIQGSGDNR